MQIKNIQIFFAAIGAAADGAWIDVSNLVNLSVQVNGIEGNTWIEVSDDPNAPIDGSGIGAPSAMPTLSQFPSVPQSNLGDNIYTTPPSNNSMLPATTFFVTTTFITKWGETTASTENSLAVSAGNYLYVTPPVPTAAQAPYVTGWNAYVGLVTMTEVLQTGPQFQPMRLIDGIGTVNVLGGGTVQTLGPNSSTHFVISGGLPLNRPFAMTNGFQQTQWVSPVADQSGGAAAGIKLQTTLVGATSAANINYAITGTNVMVNPSGITWHYLRVRKDSSSTALATTAWLMGQNG